VSRSGRRRSGLEEQLWQAGIAAIFLYTALGLLRLGIAPLRRRLGRSAADATWFRRLLLRIGSTLLILLTIPLAIFIGICAMRLVGLATSTANGRGAQISDIQALFVNAFAAVEAALAVLRFFLSPQTADLRMITLPERGVRGLWAAGRALIYAVGYGQLFFVPVISSEISVFVGVLVCGLVYVWSKGDLEWMKTVAAATEAGEAVKREAVAR